MFVVAPLVKGGLQQLCHNQQEPGKQATCGPLPSREAFSKGRKVDCGDANCLGSIAGGVVAFALIGMQINGAMFAGGPLKRHPGETWVARSTQACIEWSEAKKLPVSKAVCAHHRGLLSSVCQRLNAPLPRRVFQPQCLGI